MFHEALGFPQATVRKLSPARTEQEGKANRKSKRHPENKETSTLMTSSL